MAVADTDVETDELFRENLRKMIDRRGVTVRDLSEESGVSVTHIYEILANKKHPTLKAAGLLCIALNVPLSKMV